MCLGLFSDDDELPPPTRTLRKRRKRLWSPDGALGPPPPYTPAVSTTSLIPDPNLPVRPPSYRYSTTPQPDDHIYNEAYRPPRPRRRSHSAQRRVSNPYPPRQTQSEPHIMSTQGNTVYGNRNRSRFLSSTNLPSALAGRLQTAAQSVTNLNENRSNSNCFERISSRLNDIIEEIDNEAFQGGPIVLGNSSCATTFT
jgi:hypothetical protein